MGERPMNTAAQLLVAQAGGQGVDRHQTTGVDTWTVGALVVRVFEDELSALQQETTTQRDWIAGLHPEASDAMAKPHGGDRAGVVADRHAEFFQSTRQV